MKKILFLSLLIPAVVHAQFTRSATELAKENVHDYVTTKLFKNASYQAVSYGHLLVHKEHDSAIEWAIEHEFAITEVHDSTAGAAPSRRLFKFLFYFDRKMNVLRADSYF